MNKLENKKIKKSITVYIKAATQVIAATELWQFQCFI